MFEGSRPAADIVVARAVCVLLMSTITHDYPFIRNISVHWMKGMGHRSAGHSGFVRDIESSVENCMSQRGTAGAVYCLVECGLVNLEGVRRRYLRPSAPPPAWKEREREKGRGHGRWLGGGNGGTEDVDDYGSVARDRRLRQNDNLARRRDFDAIQTGTGGHGRAIRAGVASFE